MGFKIGDEVVVLHYEELSENAPPRYIGRVGIITSLDKVVSGTSRNIEVTFDETIRDIFNKWDFSPEQLKLVETN